MVLTFWIIFPKSWNQHFSDSEIFKELAENQCLLTKPNLHPRNTKLYALQLAMVLWFIMLFHTINGSRIDVLSQPRGSFHMDKMNNLFFQTLIRFINLKSLFFCDLLCYFHKKSEIIQNVTCDNCDGFQHLSFIFSWKFISL